MEEEGRGVPAGRRPYLARFRFPSPPPRFRSLVAAILQTAEHLSTFLADQVRIECGLSADGVSRLEGSQMSDSLTNEMTAFALS